jgi:hypothetical protein
LWQVSNTHLRSLVHGQFGNIDIVEKHFSFIWFYQPHHLVKGSGFAGPVRTKQAYDLALTHIKRYVVYHRATAVSFYKVLGLDGQVQIVLFFTKIGELW